jgi:hypothetical protein
MSNPEKCPDIEGRDIRIPTAEELRSAKVTYIARSIAQQLIQESPYGLGSQDLDWAVWHEAHEWQEQNGLPDGVSADDIYNEHLRQFDGE